MLCLLLVLLSNAFLNQAALFQCDFESVCNDFVTDNYWRVTDDLHLNSIDHDHTLNTSSGHYLFYNPQNLPPFYVAEIKTNQWLQPSMDSSMFSNVVLHAAFKLSLLCSTYTRR